MTSRRNKTRNFQESVWEATKLIPGGKVSTYGHIARYLGNPGASRAVGNALNKNPFLDGCVPCHRVVRTDGSLGGFALGSEEKARRLAREGVKIVNKKIDLARFGYWI